MECRLPGLETFPRPSSALKTSHWNPLAAYYSPDRRVSRPANPDRLAEGLGGCPGNLKPSRASRGRPGPLQHVLVGHSRRKRAPGQPSGRSGVLGLDGPEP